MGLLGPNGAGKTTFLRLLMGFIFPTLGTITRAGISPSQTGYLPDQPFYPNRFGIRDYLTVLGRLSGIHKARLSQTIDRLLEQVGLEQVDTLRLGACSRGMLQRVGLAQALLGNPQLLLLDEPVLGLDPEAQRFMRDQISALRKEGRTIILSSHHLEEVTRLCTHVAILHQGHIVRQGTLEDLLAPQPRVTIATEPVPPAIHERIMALHNGIQFHASKIILSDHVTKLKAQVLRILLDSDIDILSVAQEYSSLEDVYLEVTRG